MKKVIIKSIGDYLKHIQIVANLARQKMLVQTICAVIESRSVSLPEVAHHLNPEVKTASNETRLRDFFREVTFNYDELAAVLVNFLKEQPNVKVRLTVDRTNWKFGTHATNILMIIASKGSYSVPLYWEMLDNKGGNSNTEQRIDIFKKCIDIIGAQQVGLVLGDREFIGHDWLKFLKDNKLPFCVRVPKSHYIENINQTKFKAEDVWAKHKQRTDKSIFEHCMVDGVWGGAMITTDAKGELLYLFGTADARKLDQFYAKRWTIETMFQAFKGRGFDLEVTHISKNDRLRKLVGVVALAFAFCIAMGQFKHDHDKKITIRKHGRKTKSFFRYGLDFLRDGMKETSKYAHEWLASFTLFVEKFFIKHSFSTV